MFQFRYPELNSPSVFENKDDNYLGCHQITKTPSYTKAFCEVLCFYSLAQAFTQPVREGVRCVLVAKYLKKYSPTIKSPMFL
jgi:hypothetical protein